MLLRFGIKILRVRFLIFQQLWTLGRTGSKKLGRLLQLLISMVKRTDHNKVLMKPSQTSVSLSLIMEMFVEKIGVQFLSISSIFVAVL